MHIQGLGLAISLALGGLGLFLISIKLLSNGLKSMSGEKLRTILKKFTKTNFHSLLFGIIFTTMIQSSDGAVALAISLVAAGFMPLKSALAFVLGANIGTATTSIIVSMSSNFEFTQYFMIAAFIGGMGYLLAKEKEKSNIAIVIASLGMLFLGLKTMGAGMKTIAAEDTFKTMVSSVGDNAWLSTLTSFGMTGIMQSSSASVTIAQNIYASTTDITLVGAIGFVIGANIGTTVTALIATLGSGKDTKRIAVFWLITNTVMALIIIPMAKYYGDFIGLMVDTNPHKLAHAPAGAMGYDNFAMAIGHVFFNVTLVLIFFPLLNVMEKVTKLIIREDKETEFHYNINLPISLINESPELAIEAAKKGFQTIGEMNYDVMASVEKFLDTRHKKYLLRTEKLYIAISEMRKTLYDFIARINTAPLKEHESSTSMKLVMASRSQERVSEIVQEVEEVLKETYDPKTKKFMLSESAFSEIKFIVKIIKGVQKRAYEQSKKWSRTRNTEIVAAHKEITKFVEVAIENHINRMKGKNCLSPKIDYHDLMHMFDRVARHQEKMSKYFKRRTNNRNKLTNISTSSRIQKILED